MTCLVTGAAGFLGRHFARRYFEAGETVIGIDNLQNEHSYWPDPVEEHWEGEGQLLRIEDDLAVALAALPERRYDVALHFAAPVGGREKIEYDPLFNADSLRLDAAFFRWAVKVKPKAVVYPSSSAVYPVSAQVGAGEALRETLFRADAPVWGAPDELYGFTKLAGERLALAASSYGLRTLAIRPFSGYGEGQSHEYPVTAIAKRAVRREDPLVVWGDGGQRRDFIHVDDITKAVVARLNAGFAAGYEPLNLGSGVATSFDEIAVMCAEIVGYAPVFSHDVSKPVGVESRFSDPRQMQRYYKPQVGLRDGLTRVVRWLQIP